MEDYEGRYRWLRQAGLPGRFIEGSVCAMRFLGMSSFDVVFDGSCLHCLIGEDRRRCLAEVRRVLRRDGVFIVSSMCGQLKSPDTVLQHDEARGLLLSRGEPYRTLRPLPALVAELGQAGFVVGERTVDENPWWDHATITCRQPRSTPARRGEA